MLYVLLREFKIESEADEKKLNRMTTENTLLSYILEETVQIVKKRMIPILETPDIKVVMVQSWRYCGQS